MIEATINIREANAMALTALPMAATALEIARYLEMERAAISVNLPIDSESFSFLEAFRAGEGRNWLVCNGYV